MQSSHLREHNLSTVLRAVAGADAPVSRAALAKLTGLTKPTVSKLVQELLEAGLLVDQLKAGGFTGTFLSGDGSLDPGFVEAAGTSADGSILTCPCAPAAGQFATDYEALAGQAPGTYSAEGYDAANVFLQGLAGGNGDRESMLAWVNGYDAAGVTKQIKFDETGEVADVVVYAYTVEGTEILPGEPIE